MGPPSALDEALAHYCVSREVPGSILKCETVLGTLDATPKVPLYTDLTRGATREALMRAMKSESEVTQLCLTLYDPMYCSLPGSSVHGIFQA